MLSDFYPKIGKPAPSDEEMLDRLRKSVRLSREKHYHGDKGIVVLSPEGKDREVVCITDIGDVCVVMSCDVT